MTLLKISNLIHAAKERRSKETENECEWVEFLAYQCQCLWGHRDLRLTRPFVTCPLWSQFDIFLSISLFSWGRAVWMCCERKTDDFKFRVMANNKKEETVRGEKVFTIIFRSMSVKTLKLQFPVKMALTDWLILHPQHWFRLDNTGVK